MDDPVSLEQFIEWLEEGFEKDLWFEIDGPASGQLAGHIRALMARIELLEAEVLRVGEVLDTVPSVALEWTSTDQPPPDFAERLLKAWGKTALKTLRNSEYQKLLRAKYMTEEKAND
jgi:hypothetical protein